MLNQEYQTKSYSRRAFANYYQKNKDNLKVKSLDNYYKKKAEDKREPQFKIFCKLFGLI